MSRPAFDAGALPHRVTIERPVGTPDDGGGETVAWETVAVVWARVEPLRADERTAGAHLAMLATHRVILRWRDDVSGGMRVVHRGRALRVRAAADPDETRRFLELAAQEERA